jgi:hypothetical protein
MHGGQAPEFYVNDVKVTAAEAHAIAPNDIATVNVEKGASGGDASVIRIRTLAVSANGMRYRSAGPDAAPSAGAATGLKGLHEKMAGSTRIFSGVILINGVRADAAAMHKLDPKDIAGVEVIKGAAATAMLSDPAAKNGVIRITTK